MAAGRPPGNKSPETRKNKLRTSITVIRQTAEERAAFVSYCITRDITYHEALNSLSRGDMIEIYVYMEGAEPKEVVLGRRQAVDRMLADGFKTNPDERRRISLFMEAGPCDLGSGLRLVGFPPEVPDRRIIRVVGPGALV